MSPTPYAPPAARVIDPAERLLPKPLWIKLAVACLWISLGLTIAMAVPQLLGLVASAVFVNVGLTVIATAVLLWFVATQISSGHGWVRWLYVVLYLFGTFGFIVSILFAPEMFLSLPVPRQAVDVVQFMLQTSALVLMFTPASQKWFTSTHTATTSDAL